MFDFNYTGGRDQLLRLYDKGTRRQWIGSDRLDWSQEVDLDQPRRHARRDHARSSAPSGGTKMSDERKGELRRHVEAWRFSQFMHGEQGALICTAKIVQTVPDIDSKFYAATQVIDEARHVEVYSRYLHEKVQLVYPLNQHLKALLDDVIADSRWDMTYLGMQVLIEGLALAAFGIIRNNATESAGQGAERLRHAGRGAPRHVRAPGAARLLPAAEPGRARRAGGLLHRGLLPDARPLLGRGGLGAPGAAARDHAPTSRRARRCAEFRNFLFMRIVPILRDIGLWGPKLRTAFEEMGVIGFADTDIDAEMAERREGGRGSRRGPRRPHGPREGGGRARPEAARG